MTRPGELALGVMAGLELRALRRLGEREASFEMRDEMPDPMRPHHRQRRIEAALDERRRLVERARFEHRVEAGVDAPIERVAVRGEKEARPCARAKRRRCARPLERDERPTRRGENFERADDPLAVGRLQAGRRRGIERGELGVQLGGRAACGFGAGRGADGLRGPPACRTALPSARENRGRCRRRK